MDEIIVRVARTVACHARLQILSALARDGECSPSELARQLGTGLDSVCVHLKHLTTAGLMQRRRSGAWCYGVAGSPYTEQAFSGKVAAWLYRLLRDPSRSLRGCAVDTARNQTSPDAEGALHAIVFEAATAFANVRRLQILRRLQLSGAATTEVLSAELSISESALSRHIAKLRRRGYVQATDDGRLITYRMAARPKTSVHAELLGFVTAEWRKGQLRS
jgi:DNA-binding transcriptional ArsR family regulator